MKLQLNERTLNAYINEAIRQELNEGLKDLLLKPVRRFLPFLAKDAGEKVAKETGEKIAREAGGKATEKSLLRRGYEKTKDFVGRETRKGRNKVKSYGRNLTGKGTKFTGELVDDSRKTISKLEGELDDLNKLKLEQDKLKQQNLAAHEKWAKGMEAERGRNPHTPNGEWYNEELGRAGRELDRAGRELDSKIAAKTAELNKENRRLRTLLGRHGTKRAAQDAARYGTGAGLAGFGAGYLLGKSGRHKHDPWNEDEDEAGGSGPGGGTVGFDGTFPWDSTTPVYTPKPKRRKKKPAETTPTETAPAPDPTPAETTPTEPVSEPTAPIAKTEIPVLSALDNARINGISVPQTTPQIRPPEPSLTDRALTTMAKAGVDAVNNGQNSVRGLDRIQHGATAAGADKQRLKQGKRQVKKSVKDANKQNKKKNNA